MRLQMLRRLREPERHFPTEKAVADPAEVGVCVSHIRAKAGLAQSAVSASMAELRRAGLVRATRVGKWTHYERDEERIAGSSPSWAGASDRPGATGTDAGAGRARVPGRPGAGAPGYRDARSSSPAPTGSNAV
ncbi:hypothetical protein [Streptomyces sp. NPDC046942]|uniref:ArsR/SmtB family transcription factor n=1 Tax=Streptomyces sp. NPDC046942 TaxID=3155137 RepID=UPI003408A82D